MEAKIISGPVGGAGKYSVDFKDGNLVAVLEVAEGPFSGNLLAKIDAGQVLDALAKAVPGQLDDAVIAVIKAALKA